MMQTTFDYIIAGAGSAGCVLARRLSDAGHQVLLLEEGGNDASWILQMPAGLRSAFKPSSKYNSWFYTSPQKHLNGRKIQQPRGRVLGGCSSINGMTWLRGHAQDYNRWAEQGADGWQWQNCLPYFKKLENAPHVKSPYRGNLGPMHAQVQSQLSPLNAAFLEACTQAGHPISDDVNGYQQYGASRFEMSVKDGIRNSASFGYLHQQKAAKAELTNLTVLTHCKVLKVNLQGTKATGVQVFYKGATHTFSAQKETLLSSGVFASPQLLMLSGIGPSEQLKSHQIPCVADLQGVGENLQDHLECHIQIETKQALSLNRELQPHRMLWAGMQWFGFKKGVASVNQCHVGAFLNSDAKVAHPDVQFHFFPVFFDKNWIPVPTTYGYRIGVGPMRPTSRGSVRLQSNKASDAMLINPNYMATQEDWQVMRQAMLLGLEVAQQPAFKPYHHKEHTPGPLIRTGQAMDDFIRDDAASAYHPCGTCKMGKASDVQAVVNNQLQVLGIENLRVVDASVMPSVPSANINAATIMLAERASDMILGQPGLPPENLPFHYNYNATHTKACV